MFEFGVNLIYYIKFMNLSLKNIIYLAIVIFLGGTIMLENNKF